MKSYIVVRDSHTLSAAGRPTGGNSSDGQGKRAEQSRKPAFELASGAGAFTFDLATDETALTCTFQQEGAVARANRRRARALSGKKLGLQRAVHLFQVLLME